MTYGCIELKNDEGETITFEGGDGEITVGVDENTSDYEHPHRGMAEAQITREHAIEIILFLEEAFA